PRAGGGPGGPPSGARGARGGGGQKPVTGQLVPPSPHREKAGGLPERPSHNGRVGSEGGGSLRARGERVRGRRGDPVASRWPWNLGVRRRLGAARSVGP